MDTKYVIQIQCNGCDDWEDWYPSDEYCIDDLEETIDHMRALAKVKGYLGNFRLIKRVTHFEEIEITRVEDESKTK